MLSRRGVLLHHQAFSRLWGFQWRSFFLFAMIPNVRENHGNKEMPESRNKDCMVPGPYIYSANSIGGSTDVLDYLLPRSAANASGCPCAPADPALLPYDVRCRLPKPRPVAWPKHDDCCSGRARYLNQNTCSRPFPFLVATFPTTARALSMVERF